MTLLFLRRPSKRKLFKKNIFIYVISAEEECDRKMSIQVAKHNAMRCDISNLCTDIDKDIQDNFCYRH